VVHVTLSWRSHQNKKTISSIASGASESQIKKKKKNETAAIIQRRRSDPRRVHHLPEAARVSLLIRSWVSRSTQNPRNNHLRRHPGVEPWQVLACAGGLEDDVGRGGG
jgi:hypothetical protein